jgi:hypothetical protein
MPVEENDGGLSEGQTITPLENRVDDSNLPFDIQLTDEKKPSAPTTETPSDKKEVQSQLPAWARQN